MRDQDLYINILIQTLVDIRSGKPQHLSSAKKFFESPWYLQVCDYSGINRSLIDHLMASFLLVHGIEATPADEGVIDELTEVLKKNSFNDNLELLQSLINE